MNVRFFDRQDTSSQINGEILADGESLSKLIESLRGREPFFCELVGENGYNLMIGIGKDVGCAQYSAGNGNPPYLMAAIRQESSNRGCAKFLAGGTLTPVTSRFCLPFDVVRRVAVVFLETGCRSSECSWEEI
jgi:hypothetical protein